MKIYKLVLAVFVLVVILAYVSSADTESTDTGVTKKKPRPTEEMPTPTETEPTPTPTETEPTPTPTETEPTPTPTETEPTPTPTETEPTPTPTETEPTPTPTETEPTPTPTETEPTPTPTETEPTPTPVQTSTPAGSSGTSSESSSSSSSSSSGGGMSTSNVDPYSNIFKYEVRETNLFVNQSVEYRFVTPELGIYEVLLNGKENEYDVSVRIESLKNTSKYIKVPAPGIVYRNENVVVSSSRINYMGIKFKVNNSWLKENQLDDKWHPYLLKWNGTVWLVLKTDIIGKDEEYTYFESSKAGRSRIGLFAISAPPKMTRPIEDIGEEELIISDKERIEISKIPKTSGFNIMDVIITIIGVILISIYIEKKK